MNADADLIVDRRRLRRKVGAWRLATFVAAAAAVIVGLYAGGWWPFSSAHIARITLTGVLVEDRQMLRTLDRLAESDSVRAVVVTIDSPGGTTAAAEAIHDALRGVAEAKPVVARLGTLGTSAAYAAALAADHIVARRTTITGSIGVLVQWANLSELLESMGVEVDSVKSAPLKASPNPFEPTSPEAREALGALVEDSYEWFVALVADRRGLDAARARDLSDGRVMTGRQAYAAGLVDSLGGEEEALAWLTEERGIESGLPTRDWTRDRWHGVGAGSGAWLARAFGFDGLARALERSLVGPGGLDGLVSVWHPQVIEE